MAKNEGIGTKVIIWIIGIIFLCGIAYAAIQNNSLEIKENKYCMSRLAPIVRMNTSDIKLVQKDISYIQKDVAFIRTHIEKVGK